MENLLRGLDRFDFPTLMLTAKTIKKTSERKHDCVHSFHPDQDTSRACCWRSSIKLIKDIVPPFLSMKKHIFEMLADIILT